MGDVISQGARGTLARKNAGGGTYYGSSATPFSGGSYYSTGNTTGYCVAFKVDLGGSKTGNVTEIEMRVRDIDAGTREANFCIYDDNSGVPGTILVSAGRFVDASTASTTKTVTKTLVGKSITSESIVWLAFFTEARSNVNPAPKMYYNATTGAETLTVDLASNEWLNDSAEGDSWTDLFNHASAGSETWEMDMRFLLE